MPLTAVAINAAVARSHPFKLTDERGLFLLVQPSGGKLWRLKYRFAGKEKKLSLGVYPETSLKDARASRDHARKLLADGVDPSAQKRRDRAASAFHAANTFSAVAEEYLANAKRKDGLPLAPVTLSKARWLLELLATKLGGRPIAEISAPELLAAIRVVEGQGKLETARRLRSFAGRVFRFGIATFRATHDISVDIRDALTTPTVKHQAAILDPDRVGDLLRAIDGYGGRPSTCLALQFAPHVFVRPCELRRAEWPEFDFARAVWTIPGAKTKMRKDHHVPLSRQALAILRSARKISTSTQGYVFPSSSNGRRPISENTLNLAMRRMSFAQDEMTSHGFRALASTLLNESGKWNPDAIERALGHGQANKVRAAYHRGAYWDERVRMAQWWSNYLDALRKGSNVVRLRRNA